MLASYGELNLQKLRIGWQLSFDRRLSLVEPPITRLCSCEYTDSVGQPIVACPRTDVRRPRNNGLSTAGAIRDRCGRWATHGP